MIWFLHPKAQLIRETRHNKISLSEKADLELEEDNDLYQYQLNVESSALFAVAILEEICQGRPFKSAFLGASSKVVNL